MAKRRWNGDVIKVENPRFKPGSPEHIEYKEKQKKYYYDTADLQRERARNRMQRRRERNQQWIVNYVAGRACARCGEADTRVLAFDHLDECDKYANIADLVSRGACFDKLVAEVGKCRILCHNCHMLHTFEQVGGTYHSRLTPCSEEEFLERFKDVL